MKSFSLEICNSGDWVTYPLYFETLKEAEAKVEHNKKDVRHPQWETRIVESDKKPNAIFNFKTGDIIIKQELMKKCKSP